MRKNDIVDIIWNKVDNVPKRKVTEIIDTFLAVVSSSVKNGEKIELRKFGTFYRAEVKAKQIFSPIAKKNIDVPARISVKFKESRYENKEGD